MTQPNPSTKLQQALDHERQFIARLLNDESDTVEAETMHCIQQRASAGQLNSGRTRTELLDIECRCLKRIVSSVIAKRLELATDNTELVSASNLGKLHQWIDEMIQTRFRGIIPRITRATGYVRHESEGSRDDGLLEDDKMKLLAWAGQELGFAVSEFQLRESKNIMANNLERSDKAEAEPAPIETRSRGWRQPPIVVVFVAALITAVGMIVAAIIGSWHNWFPIERTTSITKDLTETPETGSPPVSDQEGIVDRAERGDSAAPTVSPDSEISSKVVIDDSTAQVEATVAREADLFWSISMYEFFSRQYSGTRLQNEEFARQMVGKTVIWTGKIRSIESGENDGVMIVVQPIDEYGSAFLKFDSAQRDEFINLNDGQVIRFTGRIYASGPFLRDCRLLKVVRLLNDLGQE